MIRSRWISSFDQCADYKPGMVGEGGEETVVVGHDAKTLVQGGFVMAGGEAFAEVVGDDRVGVE